MPESSDEETLAGMLSRTARIPLQDARRHVTEARTAGVVLAARNPTQAQQSLGALLRRIEPAPTAGEQRPAAFTVLFQSAPGPDGEPVDSGEAGASHRRPGSRTGTGRAQHRTRRTY
jgi:hypothetical protein